MKFCYLLLISATGLLASATTENGTEVIIKAMERTLLSEERIDSIVQHFIGPQVASKAMSKVERAIEGRDNVPNNIVFRAIALLALKFYEFNIQIWEL